VLAPLERIVGSDRHGLLPYQFVGPDVRNETLEMFRRTLPEGASRRRLGRLANRLTKIVREAHTLDTPDK
jgi:hypothetical protein